MAQQREYVTLDGCEVVAVTEKGVLLAWVDVQNNPAEAWTPRSQYENGAAIQKGDKDLVLAKWIADDKHVPYSGATSIVKSANVGGRGRMEAEDEIPF